MSVLTVLSLLAMVAGLAGVGVAVNASPSHTHVFLTPEAAAAHSHADEPDDDSVVNLGDTSARSTSSPVHVYASDVSVDSVELAVFLQVPVSNNLYSDPLYSPPQPPPQTS